MLNSNFFLSSKMRILLNLSFALIATIVFVANARADFKVPELTGPVMDQVGLLNRQTQVELEALLQKFNQQQKAQIQVLIVSDLAEMPIEQAALAVSEKWQLGQAKKDNGILFLLAFKEKRTRIEVGRGLEGDIPDVIAKRILADRVRPLMREGRANEAIVAAVLSIIEKVDPEFLKQLGQSNGSIAKKEKKINGGVLSLFLFILIMLFKFLAGPMMAASGGYSRNRYRGGIGGFGGGFGGGGFGGGSGGGWSGGGGGFGGGGSSDGW
jgi:uncharacterized protein